MFAGTDDIVGPEGMEKFCEDIGVEPENVSSRSSQKSLINYDGREPVLLLLVFHQELKNCWIFFLIKEK